ncbi:MAG: DUF6090 family protein [Verrucomicrobia bacterium]|nr:DUF6090 family protein [Verrucomicrobiota bacterium]MDA1067354.1 DUF6090 family protein [Verrucomicrobiota bacterium]
MLRLFSSIRKTLINEGKTSRYVRYAVGEFLLIVAGILVALQISDWHEAGKTSAKEIKILKSLKAELESDLIALDGISLRHERIVDSANTVIQHIEEDSPYDESLSGHFFISSGGTYRMYSFDCRLGGRGEMGSWGRGEMAGEKWQGYDPHLPHKEGQRKRYLQAMESGRKPSSSSPIL